MGIRLFFIGLIVTALAGGGYYVLKLQKDNAILKANAIKLESAISSFDGIINCTPLGHFDFPGCSLGNLEIKNYQWLYDVVYTPAKTIFLKKDKKIRIAREILKIIAKNTKN